MNRIVYVYRGKCNVPDSFGFRCVEIQDVDEKSDRVYFLYYQQIINETIACDALVFDRNVLGNDNELFELILYYRLLKGENWDMPIFVFSKESSLVELLRNDYTNITKTKRFDIIDSSSFEKDIITNEIRLYSNVMALKNEPLIWDDFVNRILVEKPQTDNHSIANEWGIYQLAYNAGISINEITDFDDSKLDSLYFKWLIAKNGLCEDIPKQEKEENKEYRYKLKGINVIGRIDLSKIK